MAKTSLVKFNVITLLMFIAMISVMTSFLLTHNKITMTDVQYKYPQLIQDVNLEIVRSHREHLGSKAATIYEMTAIQD